MSCSVPAAAGGGAEAPFQRDAVVVVAAAVGAVAPLRRVEADVDRVAPGILPQVGNKDILIHSV